MKLEACVWAPVARRCEKLDITPLLPNTATAPIGVGSSGWGTNLTGSVDEFAIYPTALSQNQLESHYIASGQQPLSNGPITASENPPGNGCLACQQRELAAGTLVGHPVNPEFGNMMDSATDIVVPGRGVPLQVTRTYDSNRATAPAGPFGNGWSSDLFMSLSQTGGSGPVTITQ